MLNKGSHEGYDKIREDIFGRMETKSDICILRAGGDGWDIGKVISASLDRVVILSDKERIEILYDEILDYK